MANCAAVTAMTNVIQTTRVPRTAFQVSEVP
jgi:hypothetical protein